MSIKWIFALILLFYGLHSLAVDIPFNEIIEEAEQSQTQLSEEIRAQLVETQRKTPESITISQIVPLEGSKITIYSYTSQR